MEAKYLSDDNELEELNKQCKGKTIFYIAYIMDDLQIVFTDGTWITLSTLGGIEVEWSRPLYQTSIQS